MISRLSSAGSLAVKWRTPQAVKHERSSSLEEFVLNKNKMHARGFGDLGGRGTAGNREHAPNSRRHRRASSWSNPRDRVTPGGPGSSQIGSSRGRGEEGEGGSRLQLLTFDDTDLERGRRNALTRDNVTLLSMLYSGDGQDSGSESSGRGIDDLDYEGTDDEDVGDVTSLFGFGSPRRGGGRRNNRPLRKRTPSPHRRRSLRSPHGRSASYDLAKSPRHDRYNRRRSGKEGDEEGGASSLAAKRMGYRRRGRHGNHRRALTNISDMLAALADEGTVEVDY